MTAPAPGWLAVDDVAGWLHLAPVSAEDAVILGGVCSAVEPLVVRARPDGDFSARPAPDIYQGSVMFAARVFRRRNTASGIETFADSVTYVASRDPEIQQLLRTGPYAMPRVG